VESDPITKLEIKKELEYSGRERDDYLLKHCTETIGKLYMDNTVSSDDVHWEVRNRTDNNVFFNQTEIQRGPYRGAPFL